MACPCCGRFLQAEVKTWIAPVTNDMPSENLLAQIAVDEIKKGVTKPLREEIEFIQNKPYDVIVYFTGSSWAGYRTMNETLKATFAGFEAGHTELIKASRRKQDRRKVAAISWAPEKKDGTKGPFVVLATGPHFELAADDVQSESHREAMAQLVQSYDEAIKLSLELLPSKNPLMISIPYYTYTPWGFTADTEVRALIEQLVWSTCKKWVDTNPSVQIILFRQHKITEPYSKGRRKAYLSPYRDLVYLNVFEKDGHILEIPSNVIVYFTGPEGKGYSEMEESLINYFNHFKSKWDDATKKTVTSITPLTPLNKGGCGATCVILVPGPSFPAIGKDLALFKDIGDSSNRVIERVTKEYKDALERVKQITIEAIQLACSTSPYYSPLNISIPFYTSTPWGEIETPEIQSSSDDAVLQGCHEIAKTLPQVNITFVHETRDITLVQGNFPPASSSSALKSALEKSGREKGAVQYASTLLQRSFTADMKTFTESTEKVDFKEKPKIEVKTQPTVKQNTKSPSYSIKLRVIKGDIFEEPADCIVNAANEGGLGGGGVDGQFMKKGGDALAQERLKIPIISQGVRILTGSSVVTTSGDIKTNQNCGASFVIHAVGPDYRGYANTGGKSSAPFLHLRSADTLEYALKKLGESFPHLQRPNKLLVEAYQHIITKSCPVVYGRIRPPPDTLFVSSPFLSSGIFCGTEMHPYDIYILSVLACVKHLQSYKGNIVFTLVLFDIDSVMLKTLQMLIPANLRE